MLNFLIEHESKGTLGIVCLLGSLVLADSSSYGELEYFNSEFDCETSRSFLTEEYKAELTYCISANNETVNIAGNEMIHFDWDKFVFRKSAKK